MSTRDIEPPDPRDFGLDPDTVVSSRWGSGGTPYFTLRSTTAGGYETGATHEIRWTAPPPVERGGFWRAMRRVGGGR